MRIHFLVLQELLEMHFKGFLHNLPRREECNFSLNSLGNRLKKILSIIKKKKYVLILFLTNSHMEQSISGLSLQDGSPSQTHRQPMKISCKHLLGFESISQETSPTLMHPTLILIATEHLFCARCHAKHFTCIIIIHHHKSPLR